MEFNGFLALAEPGKTGCEKCYEEITVEEGKNQLIHLDDGLNHIFIQRDEIGLDGVVNHDIRQIEKQYRFVIQNVGNAVSHRGNQ